MVPLENVLRTSAKHFAHVNGHQNRHHSPCDPIQLATLDDVLRTVSGFREPCLPYPWRGR